LHPSRRAASSSSTGSARKNWRIKKMPKALDSQGIAAAVSVLMTFIRLKRMNVGIIRSWIGTMIVATITKKLGVRPANLSRAKPYPARLHSTRCESTATVATTVVLASQRRISESVNRAE
jgi:hypothetical protein